MKISSKYLIMSVLLLPSLTVSGAKPTQTPSQEFKYRAKFVRTYLAGSRLSPAQKNFLKFDKKEGYYLNSYSDGLGRLMSIKLVLSPDPKRIGDPYSDGEIAKKSITFTVLPRLRTGKGVNIGDSPAASAAQARFFPYDIAIQLQIKGARLYLESSYRC
jgi:hypothetical protein